MSSNFPFKLLTSGAQIIKIYFTGSGRSQREVIWEQLQKWGLEPYMMALSFDTCPTNGLWRCVFVSHSSEESEIEEDSLSHWLER